MLLNNKEITLYWNIEGLEEGKLWKNSFKKLLKDNFDFKSALEGFEKVLRMCYNI